ncbi:fibrobacter succinogenes major paralogous domain-containing protein [Fibrobacter succinogenes]|uniref:fibrobacter succinogenes major paralogous domain-containing protein n=1 Tax=Fibrobacter succinogenes TaxID=833 RepID=UPI0015685E9A|nr:fibrobacter succinogenes major paralogous domain-containing protein [Fibrobacter succinogenes]
MNKRILLVISLLAASSIAAPQKGIMTDSRDGKKYKTVKIGEQTWMAENLNYGKISSSCYEKKNENCTKYGRFYTWRDAQQACPRGWHLPSKKEWDVLLYKAHDGIGNKLMYRDVDTSFSFINNGKYLKSRTGWKDNRNGTDAFGFSVIPIVSSSVGEYAEFWSSTEYEGNGQVWVTHFGTTDWEATQTTLVKWSDISVRCLKDVDSAYDSSSEDVRMISDAYGEMLTDPRDGKKYKTVKIGEQTWMAENLNYEAKNSLCYDNKPSNCKKYGRLYSQDVAQSVCPEGWHLPDTTEFLILIDAVGLERSAGRVLKSRSGWKSNTLTDNGTVPATEILKLIRKSNSSKDGNGTDDYGFSALPAGSMIGKSSSGVGERANFLIDQGSDFLKKANSGKDRFQKSLRLNYNDDGVDISLSIDNIDYKFSASVRCLKDINSAYISSAKDVREISDHQKDILTDLRDGKQYKTVKIGEQTWMAENLNYNTPYSYCYEGEKSNCSRYGRLYKWQAALKACPAGWHLPSMTEFETLFHAVGGFSSAGQKLKATTLWKKELDITNDDVVGFAALPGGYMDNDWNYGGVGDNAHFWSSTEYDSGYAAYNVDLYYSEDGAFLHNDMESISFSVRCLKD